MLEEIGDKLGRSRKVAEIHHADIEKMHRDISKRAVVRANRMLALASKAFSLALMPLPGEQEPWCHGSNPCRGVKHNPESGGERFFTTAEIAALVDALDMADSARQAPIA